MECLGFTDNGIQREERYSKKSHDAQQRLAEIVNHPMYDVSLKSVGLRETVRGPMQCTEVIIKGKEIVTRNSDGKIIDISYHNTEKVPPVRFHNGELK
jgi:hypothetical protein